MHPGYVMTTASYTRMMILSIFYLENYYLEKNNFEMGAKLVHQISSWTYTEGVRTTEDT